MSETPNQPLHPQPFRLRNNRKLTLARLKMLDKVQSIPVYEELKDKNGYKYYGKLLGYKHIYHG